CFRRVSAVHRVEDSVRTRLQRQVNVLDQFRYSRECVDQVIMKSNRMWRRKAESFEPVDFVHSFEQLHKRAFAAALRKLMAAVQIHDLPKQSNFLYTA